MNISIHRMILGQQQCNVSAQVLQLKAPLCDGFMYFHAQTFVVLSIIPSVDCMTKPFCWDCWLACGLKDKSTVRGLLSQVSS